MAEIDVVCRRHEAAAIWKTLAADTTPFTELRVTFALPLWINGEMFVFQVLRDALGLFHLDFFSRSI
jgi:hypothetical protein